ncbi:hypothetical protein C8J57DRAFT_1243444 [Mycena rebaudengoi]|nr:hypothetical protein C8J57DRAFT_1243444 [Mycena rebaudengoi]
MPRRLVPVSEASLVSSIFPRLISFAAVLSHTQGHHGFVAWRGMSSRSGCQYWSLSVEGHLFPTGLFPFQAFEGVSAERGRIRSQDWAQGVASGHRKLPNELDRRGHVRTHFSSIPTSSAPSSFVPGQIRVHPPVAVRGLFWVEGVPSCLVSANYIAYPIWVRIFCVGSPCPTEWLLRHDSTLASWLLPPPSSNSPHLCMPVVDDFSNPAFAIDRCTGVPVIHRRSSRPRLPIHPVQPNFYVLVPPAPYRIRKMSASTKKGKGKVTAPLSISSSSSSDALSPPKPRPAFRKRKDAPESSPSPAPGARPISQIAADVGDPSHRESKHARMSELDGDESSLSDSLDPAFENTHLDGAFHQINTREALGFEPVRVHEGDRPVPNTRPDGVLIAEARRFTDTDLPESVVPSKFGSADFVVLDSPYLAPVFNPATSVATLIIRGREFLNTVILHDHLYQLVDPRHFPVPSDEELLPPPVLELPEPPTPQYIPFPPDATTEALEENFHRNKEISKLAGQAHARRKSEAVAAFKVAKTEYLSRVASLRRKFDRRRVKEHEAWRKHDELRRKISNHFLCHERARDVAVAMLKGPPGRAASEVLSLTLSPPSAKKKPSGHVVGGKVLRSSNSNRRVPGAANVVDSDSRDAEYVDSGEEEANDTSEGWGVEPEPEPSSSRKSAPKRRGARSDRVTDEPDFDEFCEEVYGHVVIGSRLKSGTLAKLSGLLSRKKSDGTVVTVAADSLEGRHLEHALEKRVWQITGPYVPIRRVLGNGKKLPTTNNGYLLSLTHPKLVAGLEHHHIGVSCYPPIAFFIHGAGCTHCFENDLACIRQIKGHQLNQLRIECARHGSVCVPVKMFGDFDWSYTDHMLIQVNCDYFFVDQHHCGALFEKITGQRFPSAAFSSCHPVFGDTGNAGVLDRDDKGKALEKIPSDVDDVDSEMRAPSPRLSREKTPPPVAGPSRSSLSHPPLARQDSPQAPLSPPAVAQTSPPQCSSPARVASPNVPPVEVLAPPSSPVSSSPTRPVTLQVTRLRVRSPPPPVLPSGVGTVGARFEWPGSVATARDFLASALPEVFPVPPGTSSAPDAVPMDVDSSPAAPVVAPPPPVTSSRANHPVPLLPLRHLVFSAARGTSVAAIGFSVEQPGRGAWTCSFQQELVFAFRCVGRKWGGLAFELRIGTGEHVACCIKWCLSQGLGFRGLWALDGAASWA